MLRLLKRKEKDPRAELRGILGGYELPTLSSSLVSLLGLLREPDVPMSEVAKRAEMDPGLTVRILRLINSAGFGLLTQVSNLQHAVALLGRSRLESLVLTFAAADGIPARVPCLDTAAFWGAASRRATLARVLAQHLHAATQAEAFTAALLQDIGVPVLAASSPEEYSVVLARWHEEEDSHLDELERERFGFDHTRVGALVAEDWGLPQYLIDAIGGHHGQGDGPTPDPACHLVSLLNYSREDDGTEEVKRVAELDFGIEEELMEEMIHRSHVDAQQFSGVFGG